MNNIILYQHLGLGDHIVCNGLTRELYKKYDKLVLLVKEHNFMSVSSMFKDINIGYFVGKDDPSVDQFAKRCDPDKVLKIGHNHLNLKKNFDRSFYEESGLDFETRWSSWHIPRDMEREESLFNHIGVKAGEYVFVHDDNRFMIKPELLPQNTLIVKPHPKVTPNIFDWLTVIERAKEIHCIASTFMFIVDSIKTCDNINVHRYMRHTEPWCEPTLKRNWNIIK